MKEVLALVEDVAFGLIGKEHWDSTMKPDELKSFPKALRRRGEDHFGQQGRR